MNIGFILPGANISGGIYVVFEHASRINRIHGNKVFIITETKVNPNEYLWHESAGELSWLTFDEGIAIGFDYLIATFWKTAYFLGRLTSKHYVYFVQSIESRFYPDEKQYIREWVDTTYALCLPTITEATWIKDYLVDKYRNNISLVKNGIRKDLYNLDGDSITKRNHNKLRVLVEGPLNIEFKNVKKTLDLCYLSSADEVWLLTSTATDDNSLADRIFSQIPINEVSNIYRSCDVLVKLSYIEGMFGPPLEMFHCGGTAIVYNVTGHDEYIIDNYNGIVIETDDDTGVINAINRLKHNPDLLSKLKQNALETASKWQDWNKSSLEFYNALIQINVSYDPNIINAMSVQVDKWIAVSSSVGNFWYHLSIIKQKLQAKFSINNIINYIKKAF